MKREPVSKDTNECSGTRLEEETATEAAPNSLEDRLSVAEESGGGGGEGRGPPAEPCNHGCSQRVPGRTEGEAGETQANRGG